MGVDEVVGASGGWVGVAEHAAEEREGGRVVVGS